MILFHYVLICLIFGTTFLAIKVGVDAGVDPLLSAGLRFFIAGLLVVVYFAIRKQFVFSFFWSKSVLLIGFCLTTMTFATLYWAEQYITSGLASVLSAFGPIMVFLLHTKTTKTNISISQGIGLLLGILGVLLISFPGLQHELSVRWFLAAVAVVFGQFFYSIGAVHSKSFLKENPSASPFFINGVQMMIGGLFLLILSIVFERPSLSSLILPDVQVSLLYLIVIGSIAGHGLFYSLVHKTNPVFPSTWLYVSPVIAVSLGALLLDETLSAVTAVGAVSILIGVFLINKHMLLSMWKTGKLLKKVE
ncbi:EamA family transporter [Domibacillus sp. A3M-37]|uniref:DMT family transporter n=1 Tax=Domibacillus sp. A3M-37 TaxID=2962037 RepID=UPI0020B8DCA6|nr:EamA family transporter [Domibacillus sp. A3M-37]MCP3761682.1 EamA family transporter [Domibacillus sp. A3M-37]